MRWSNCASNAKENRFAREFAFKPWKKGGGEGGKKKRKKKKHQESFPVVIRLPTSNETIPYFMKLKLLLPSNFRQVQLNLPNKIIALRTTQSSIHLIILAFGAINLHWYTCLIAIWPIYYPLFLSQKLSKLFSIVEQNCHQHKLLKFGGMATNLVHKTKFDQF